MKRNYFPKSFAFILLCLFIFSCSSNKSIIKTNGIYQSQKVDDYWSYLRFYNDSTVITVSSTGEPKKIKNWFNREHENTSTGKYYVKNDSLFFESESKYGVVIYKGTITNKKLNLKSESLINGHESEKNFIFKKLNLNN